MRVAKPQLRLMIRLPPVFTSRHSPLVPAARQLHSERTMISMALREEATAIRAIRKKKTYEHEEQGKVGIIILDHRHPPGDILA